MRLYYEKIPEYGTLYGGPKFNGNIAGIEWRTPGIENPTKANGYMFGYDCLNRLEGSYFFKRNLGANVAQWQDLIQTTTNNYGTITGIGSESNLTYDKNGNILSLSRKCQRSNEIVNFDNFTYEYEGNKLIRVRETIKGQNDMKDFPYYNPEVGTAASFMYDANGNMTRDIARNINITYNNWLDLPYSIQFETGRLAYTYGRNGLKIAKKAYNKYNQITLDEQYFGDLITNHGIPIRILHEDGYIGLSSQMVPTFYYYMKDHLGNVRVVFTPNADNTPAFVQANDYYPFGMAYTKNLLVQGGGGTTTTNAYVNKFLYNGKEEQDMPGKWLDYGARFYDTQLGRWHSVDPMAEQSRRWSPYVYGLDNPIRFLDPDGMMVDEFNINKKTGEIIEISNKGGNTTDYFNIGTTNDQGSFLTEQSLSTQRGTGSINSFRFMEDARGTISTFVIAQEGKDITGFFLEPAGPSTTQSGQDRRILEGTFSLMKNDGSTYPNDFKLFNSEVSKDRGILMHIGNFNDNTSGCLLPGCSFGIGKIGQDGIKTSEEIANRAGFLRTESSKTKLGEINRFINSMGSENIKVNIFNVIDNDQR
jgi:RHS repeat-associated protein